MIERHPAINSDSPLNSTVSLGVTAQTTAAPVNQFLTPFQRKMLLRSLQEESRPEYRRRIEIMLLADEGQSQTQICQTLGCSAETARYWTTLLQMGQAHLWNDRPVGRPKTVSTQYLERLRELASHSPRDYGYPFQYWTAQWLSKHLAKEFCLQISDRHISRLLKQMNLSIQKHRSSSSSSSSSDSSSSSSSSSSSTSGSSLSESANSFPHQKIVINNLQDAQASDSTESFMNLWQFRHFS